MHPGVLAAGIGAVDVLLAGQAVYAMRRNDRTRDRKGVMRTGRDKREP
ncbi:MAG: hypothetical protein QOI10_3332 [Solirubrobacterales bacterium]|jgi:hypothetical protein|nr:hypothetical protein [Solirubrobacterales bacterium]